MADKTKDKAKKSEPKILFEREYIVPLRRKWLKVATYKRANKAVKALKEFMVRHMKVYDRDLRRIKIEQVLNNEIRYRGMQHPPAKIKVKAIKYDDETVRVLLVDIPSHVKYARLREEKEKAKVEKKVSKEEKKEVVEKKEEKKDEKKEIEAKEKEETSKDESLKLAEKQAKEQKHVSKDSKVMMPRKTLSR